MNKSERRFVVMAAKKLKCIRLLGSFCTHCGIDLEDKPWLAQFHHRDRSDKKFGIMAALGSQYGLKELELEIEKCDLLCCACHCTEHFSVERFNEFRQEIEKKSREVGFKSYYVTAEQKATINSLILEGLTIKEVAAQVQLSTPTVRKCILGKPKLGNDKICKVSNTELRQLRDEGFSMRDIAKLKGMSYKTVWKRCVKLSNPEFKSHSC